MSLVHRRRVMNAERLDRALRRIAAEVIEQCPDPTKIALIGIRAGGVSPTLRIADFLKTAENLDTPIGMLDITLYRDDLSDGKTPILKRTEIEFDLDGKWVVLVDDVMFTGRTFRAALDAIMGFGRPACIRAAVLIDRRGHRELPIQPDFVGLTIDTERDEAVEVKISPTFARTDKVETVTKMEVAENGS
jgi:pyrimidine operon attenuation protein/uracil phosphoribosyltransferase